MILWLSRNAWRVAGGLAVMAFVLSLGGCPSGGILGQPTVVGVWRHESGTLWTEDIDGELQWLRLSEGGTAAVYTVDADTGIVGDYTGLYAEMEAGLVAQFPRFRGDGTSPARTYTVTQADSNSLQLVDTTTGASSTFVRAAAVPNEAYQVDFDQADLFRDLPAPHSRTGLAYDGSVLWYWDRGVDVLAWPVHPETGTVGTAVDMSSVGSLRHLQATQETSFWLTQHGPHEERVTRYSFTGVLQDSIDTAVDLGFEIDVRAMAHDSAGGTLWMFGQDADENGWFLAVDSGAEPDVLLNEYEYGADVRAVTWDGEYIWALVSFAGYCVAMIDPDGFDTLATYSVPDENTSWYGIAAVDGHLFLLGLGDEDAGRICEVVP